MAKQYRMTPVKRVVSWMTKVLSRFGVGNFVVMTTVGRRSGEPREVPVAPISDDDGDYLVSPYGEVAWVRNVRADSQVRLRRGGTESTAELVEITGERPHLVEGYYHRESFARQFMDLPDDPSSEDFATYADRFPVFRIVSTG